MVRDDDYDFGDAFLDEPEPNPEKFDDDEIDIGCDPDEFSSENGCPDGFRLIDEDEASEFGVI